MEKDELPLEAVERETLEETGATIKEIKAIALCREFRARAGVFQITYYYESLLSNQGKEKLTAEEAALGIRSVWCTRKECLEILENQKGSTYHQKFSGYRDLEVFKMYERKLDESN